MGTYILQLSAAEVYAITVAESGMIVTPPAGLPLADGSYELHDSGTGNPHLGFDVKNGRQVGTVYGLRTNQIVVLPADDTVVLPKGVTLPDGAYDTAYGTFTVHNGKPGKLRFHDEPTVSGVFEGLSMLGNMLVMLRALAGRRRREPAATLEAYVSELAHIEKSIAIVEGKPCPEGCGVVHPLGYMTNMSLPQFILHIEDEIRDLRDCPFDARLPSFAEGSESDARNAGFPNKAYVPNLIERRDRVLAWKPSAGSTSQP